MEIERGGGGQLRDGGRESRVVVVAFVEKIVGDAQNKCPTVHVSHVVRYSFQRNNDAKMVATSGGSD